MACGCVWGVCVVGVCVCVLRMWALAVSDIREDFTVLSRQPMRPDLHFMKLSVISLLRADSRGQGGEEWFGRPHGDAGMRWQWLTWLWTEGAGLVSGTPVVLLVSKDNLRHSFLRLLGNPQWKVG